MATARRIRRFRPGDAQALRELFVATIRNVNRQDYTDEQVRAWAPADHDPEGWEARLRKLNPFICEVGGAIAGYADLQPDGYIDHFYVSRHHQRQGVGSALFRQIEQEARARALRELSADVSITARPFFERLGFAVIERRQVTVNDVVLDNFRMTLKLS